MEVAAKSLGMALDYCEHFGLQRMPFNDNVNPEFFYRTETHERAFFRLMVCAQQRKALGLVWGRSGTGKTLLGQMLLTALSGSEYIPVVLSAHPGMTKMGLLGAILDELEMSRPEGRENSQRFLDHIHSFLMQTYSEGRRVVLIVDEAHFLPSDQLHLIRALTNLETPQEKLCTIILLAEETFPRRLRHKRYSSLRTRVAMSAYLMPMSRDETKQYVKFRLLVAGVAEDIINNETYDLIHSSTGGICREISRLSDNALLETFLRGESGVTRSIVEYCTQSSILA